jgi:hypothetical protein
MCKYFSGCGACWCRWQPQPPEENTSEKVEWCCKESDTIIKQEADDRIDDYMNLTTLLDKKRTADTALDPAAEKFRKHSDTATASGDQPLAE